MTDFARVLADPEDDVAREIVADALQERGDPLGGFIALQMSLARVGPDDDDERERLTEEVELYLAEHDEHLRASFGVSNVSCTFVRGFPEELELTAKQLVTELPTILSRAPVRRLRITHTTVGNAANSLRTGLPLLAGTTVRGLTFAHSVPQEDLVAIFEQLELPLDSLDLWLEAEAYARLLRTPSCRALLRLRVPWTDSLAPILAAMPETLEELRCELTLNRVDARALARAPFTPRLHTLQLLNSALGDESFAELAPALRSIRALDLTTSGLHGVAAFERLEHLEELRLGSNELESHEVARLCGMEQLANLRTLRLGALPVGAPGLVALASTEWPHLAHLGLGIAQLGPEAMRHLARWLPPSIRTLELHQNRLKDEGLEAFVRSPNTRHLRELTLSRCHLGDAGLVALAHADFDALRTLDLAWNEAIGEQGCLALAGSRSFGRVKQLDLHEVRTGRAGGRALRTRFGPAVLR